MLHLRRYLLCIVLFFPLGRAAAQTDSLIRALQGSMPDTLRLEVLSELCFEYAHSIPDSALTYWQQQNELAGKLNIPRYTANAYNDLAVIQYYKGQYSEALTNNKKALEIRKGIGDKKLIISSLNKIGSIYQELGNYEQATQYQLQVLHLAEELQIGPYISLTLNNLSYIYQHVRNFPQALRCSERQLQMATENEDTLQMGIAYTSLQGIYEAMGKTDSALHCGLLAIKLFTTIGATSELAAACNDVGFQYRNMHRNDSGIYYYRQALHLAQAMESENDIAFYAANLGSAFVDAQRNDSAIRYLYLSRAHMQADTKPGMLKTLYGALSTYFILANRHDSALHYQALYTDILDTIYTRGTATQVNELLARYETEKKEQQIALLHERNQVQALTIERKNMVLDAVIILFIVFAMTGYLLYNRNKLQQEARMQQELLRQQRQAAADVVKAEEMERQRIARDLHDGIGQMFSTVKMNLSGIADRVQIPQAEERTLLDKTLRLVDDSCREVRTISHQMMPNVLLKMGLATAIRDFVDKIDSTSLKINLETYGLNKQLDADTESVIYRIVQESVNNVVKHAHASRLDIQLHKDEESITVTIEDDGKGFDVAEALRNKTAGLWTVRARVAYLNGKIDYDSAPGRGTLVAIYIPVKK